MAGSRTSDIMPLKCNCSISIFRYSFPLSYVSFLHLAAQVIIFRPKWLFILTVIRRDPLPARPTSVTPKRLNSLAWYDTHPRIHCYIEENGMWSCKSDEIPNSQGKSLYEWQTTRCGGEFPNRKMLGRKKSCGHAKSQIWVELSPQLPWLQPLQL